MAARDADVTLAADTWTEITNGATTTDVSIALISGGPIRIKATTTQSAPTGTDGFPLIAYGDGWSEATIAEKFPGLTDPDHIYGRPERPGETAVVRISHG